LKFETEFENVTRSGIGCNKSNINQSSCTVQKCQSNGQKKKLKNRFSARPWKDELGNHPKEQKRIKKIGGSRVDNEPTAWTLYAQV